MLQLVLAHGYLCGFLYENIDGHKGGICEKAGVYALVCVGTDYFFLEGFVVVAFGGGLYAEAFAGLVLERRGAHELAYAHVHVEQKVHLGNFGDIALHKYSGFLGIDAGGKVFSQNALYICMKCVGIGVCGECMKIGDEEVAVVFVLQFHKFRQGTEVVA